MQSEAAFYVVEAYSHPAGLLSYNGLQPDSTVSDCDVELFIFFFCGYFDNASIHSGESVNVGILNELLKNHGRNKSIIKARIDGDFLADLARVSSVLKR